MDTYVQHTFIQDIVKHLSVRYINQNQHIDKVSRNKDMPLITKQQIMLMNFACKSFVYLEMAKLTHEMKQQEPDIDFEVQSSDVLGLREEVRVLYRIIQFAILNEFEAFTTKELIMVMFELC